MTSSSQDGHAPVALFVFRRPDHTRRLLDSLRANPEVQRTRVHVFADGARWAADQPAVDAVRQIIRSAGLPHLELVERNRNWGLAANIIDGVTRLCAGEGRVIVLEDDLVVSSTFLRFMNEALRCYASDERVCHVSGFMYPVELPTDDEVVFLPFISSWGWATWARAWAHFDPAATAYESVVRDRRLCARFDLGGNYAFSEMLRRQVRGESSSWAIRWYLSVFVRDGLSAFPAVSLVQNEGFGADGTHCVGDAPAHVAARATEFDVTRFPRPRLSPEVLRTVSRYMGRDYRLRSRAAHVVRRLLLGARRARP